MTWSESFVGYSGRSVENGLEGVKTGSRRVTLEAFDVNWNNQAVVVVLERGGVQSEIYRR